MKTKSGSVHLRGLFLLTLGITFGSVLFASAFAGPTIYRVQPQPVQQKKIIYLVKSAASRIPIPIAYFNSYPTSTTTIPMILIGRGSESVTR